MPHRKIDALIDACITLTQNGVGFSGKDRAFYPEFMVNAIREEKPGYRLQSNHHSTPDAVINEIMDAGLMKKPEHKEFIAKHRALLAIEHKLSSVKHSYLPTREIIETWENKPLSERENDLHQMTGLGKHVDRMVRLSRDIAGLDFNAREQHISEGRRASLKHKIAEMEAEFWSLTRKMSEIFSASARRAAPRNYMEAIKEALRQPGLSKRHREFLFQAMHQKTGKTESGGRAQKRQAERARRK